MFKSFVFIASAYGCADLNSSDQCCDPRTHTCEQGIDNNPTCCEGLVCNFIGSGYGSQGEWICQAADALVLEADPNYPSCEGLDSKLQCCDPRTHTCNPQATCCEGLVCDFIGSGYDGPNGPEGQWECKSDIANKDRSLRQAIIVIQ